MVSQNRHSDSFVFIYIEHFSEKVIEKNFFFATSEVSFTLDIFTQLVPNFTFIDDIIKDIDT